MIITTLVRTRRALTLYKVYGIIALLVLKLLWKFFQYESLISIKDHRSRHTEEINSSKKVRNLKFHQWYFSYYHTSNIAFDIIRKHVYLSLIWYHICNGYEIMESTLQLVFIESQKWNLAKYCVLAIVQTHWRMKTIGVSLLGNTNELQDFISDLHCISSCTLHSIIT